MSNIFKQNQGIKQINPIPYSGYINITVQDNILFITKTIFIDK